MQQKSMTTEMILMSSLGRDQTTNEKECKAINDVNENETLTEMVAKL